MPSTHVTRNLLRLYFAKYPNIEEDKEQQHQQS